MNEEREKQSYIIYDLSYLVKNHLIHVFRGKAYLI